MKYKIPLLVKVSVHQGHHLNTFSRGPLDTDVKDQILERYALRFLKNITQNLDVIVCKQKSWLRADFDHMFTICTLLVEDYSVMVQAKTTYRQYSI